MSKAKWTIHYGVWLCDDGERLLSVMRNGDGWTVEYRSGKSQRLARNCNPHKALSDIYDLPEMAGDDEAFFAAARFRAPARFDEGGM